MKMRVADYIALHLKKIGVDHVFFLSGGMMMHLTDALVSNPNNIRYLCSHHEQASAIAADGYARFSGRLGVCYATSGPGATNILTGLVGAWQESTPMLFLTGQSKSTQTIFGSGISGLRQFGTFEVDIVPIVESVSKYAQMVIDPSTIRYHLEKALYLANAGRPGPVLLDLPLDIQGAMIDPDQLVGYEPEGLDLYPALDDVRRIHELLNNAKRPIILAGYGIRCANAVDEFNKMVRKYNIPVVTTQLGKDVLWFDHELFVGHSGPKGDRPGNFAIQSADLILSIGCSLHAQTTGWESDLFAPTAIKIQVELDEAVLAREQVHVDYKIQAGSLEFINSLLDLAMPDVDRQKWLDRCQSWKRRYPVHLEAHERIEGEINYYDFAEVLSEAMDSPVTIVADAGTSFYVMGQALRLKRGQRFISSGSMGAMGFALPAANGVAVASAGKTATICVTGDGSLMTNLHELATTSKNRLNVKLFVMNNGGYVSMRNTQNEYCEGRLVGADSSSGVFIPKMELLAELFEIPFLRCSNAGNLDAVIKDAMSIEGPVFCEVITAHNQKIIPTVASIKMPDGRMQSTQIHNMSPLLPDEIMRDELLIESSVKGF